MTKYFNIDSLLVDATTPITTGNPKQPVDWSGIPKLGDEVALKPRDASSMMVEVFWKSTEHKTYRGKVTHGYYPKEFSNLIDVGASVEFSQKKITGIHKKLQRANEVKSSVKTGKISRTAARSAIDDVIKARDKK